MSNALFSELVTRKEGEFTVSLERDLLYFYKAEQIILVPAGFVTDYASVPRAFWNILPPFGQYSEAAVVHDWLYSTHGGEQGFTRKECDAVFLQGMKDLGVPWHRRQIMHKAVRAFGWFAWRKYK